MKKDNPKILNDFLLYLVLMNYSKETIESYNIDLLLFFKFLIYYLDLKIRLKDINVLVLASVKRYDIIAFFIYLNYERNNCFKTRQRKLASIKSFYNWLFRNYPGFDNINPTEAFPYVEVTQRLPKYLKLNDALKIQSIFNNSNCRFPQRNNLIISLFLLTGMRLSELININIYNIDFNNKTIRIIGKGNKERIFYLTDKCIKEIENYLQTRNVVNTTQALICNSKGERLTKKTVERICEKAFALANLTKYKYTTHTLRHTAATYIYKETKDILLLKEILGHESIKSTVIYTHLENEVLREAVNNHPLNNFKSKREEKKLA